MHFRDCCILSTNKIILSTNKLLGFISVFFSVDFIYFMKYFILSIMDYYLFFFSPLPIIYCILLIVCQSLNNKLVRCTSQQSSINKILIISIAYFFFLSYFLYLKDILILVFFCVFKFSLYKFI